MSVLPPTITEYAMTDAHVQDLPAFVLAKVKSILEARRSLEEDLPDEDSLCYGEITSPIEEIVTSIMRWFPDRDRTVLSIYAAGASVWVRPDDMHSLAFETIPDDLLPLMSERDPSLWWVVSDTEYENFPLVLRVSTMKDEIRRCP